MRAAGDARARTWLEAGHAVLTARGDGLDEADRAGFLARIASNRDLLAAWEANSSAR